MRKYYDHSLRVFLQDKFFHELKERDLMKDLLNYLESENDKKAMILCGLKRTGKSTMIYQAIANHLGYNDVLYIRCQSNDKLCDIVNYVFNANKKYVFLDEVTRVPDFINLSGIIADDIAFAEHKIIMSGTDSLGFAIAKKQELFGRIHEIKTTYLPFSEYNRLLGKDLFHYMKYGASLCEEHYFYNEDRLNEYLNSAIVENILNTYKYWDCGEHELFSMFNTSESVLLSFVNRFLREESKKYILDILKDFNDDGHPEIKKELQSLLMIKEIFDNEQEEILRELLLKLDVLVYVKENKSYYFTQPGLLYCHINAAIDLLFDNEEIRKAYSQSYIDVVSDKIRHDVEERLIEDIDFLNSIMLQKIM